MFHENGEFTRTDGWDGKYACGCVSINSQITIANMCPAGKGEMKAFQAYLETPEMKARTQDIYRRAQAGESFVRPED